MLRYNPQEELYYTYEGINPGNSAHVIFQDEVQRSVETEIFTA